MQKALLGQVQRFACTFLVTILTATLISAQMGTVAAAAAPIGAPQQTSPCTGLDLLMLIDQSGSMQGANGNDREGFRIVAAHSIIDRLGANKLELCPDVTHRVAVVGFGDNASNPSDRRVGIHDMLPFTTIAPTRNNREQWERERARLKLQIFAENLNNTDFEIAFQRAAELLAALTQQLPPDSQPRRQVVVLITDGGPCAYAYGCPPNPAAFAGTTYHLERLQKVLDQSFPTLSAEAIAQNKGVRLWVIALRDEHAANDFNYLDQTLDRPFPTGRTLGDFWRSTAEARGGKLVVLERNENRIPGQIYRDVLTNLLGIANFQQIGCGDRKYIDPYTETVEFVLFRNDPTFDVSIEFRPVNGRPMTVPKAKGPIPGGGELVDYLSQETAERYVIYRPQPGDWIIKSSSPNCNDEVLIFQELIEPIPILREPRVTLPIGGIAPRLLYDIKERATGLDFPINQQFPLKPSATVTTPDGTVIPLAMSQDTLFGPSSLISSQTLPNSIPGTYSITLTLKIDDPNRPNFERSYTNLNTYVVAREQVALSVLAPQTNRASDVNAPQPVRIQLTSQTSGAPLELSQVFIDDPVRAVTASLSGTVVPLQVDSADLRTLVGVIEADEGSYTLNVAVKGALHTERFTLTNNELQVPFERVKPQFFDLTVSQPAEGAEIALNALDATGERKLPLSVQVSVSNPTLAFPDPTKALSATLLNERGEAVQSITLGLGTEGRFNGQVTAEREPGAYRLVVGLAQLPTDQRLRPRQNETTVRFRQVRVLPVSTSIVSPQPNVTLPLHVVGPQAAWNTVEPVIVKLQFQTNGSLLEPASILRPTGADAVSAQLTGPDGLTRPVSVTVTIQPGNPDLLVTTNAASDLAGAYRLEVELLPAALTESYVPVGSPQALSFTRADSSLLTTPWVWATVNLVALTSLLLSTLFVVGLLRTAASGDIQIDNVAVPLRLHHRIFGVTSSDLRAIGIGKISVQRDRVDPNEKAITISIFDTSSQVLVSDDRLASGEKLGQIPLENGHQGTLRYD